jgi:hypothetical protein
MKDKGGRMNKLNWELIFISHPSSLILGFYPRLSAAPKFRIVRSIASMGQQSNRSQEFMASSKRLALGASLSASSMGVSSSLPTMR